MQYTFDILDSVPDPRACEVEVNHREPEELMAEYQQIIQQLEVVQQALKEELVTCLSSDKRGKA